MELKKCTKCKVEKELSEFNKDKSRKSGLQCHCKQCKKEHFKKHYQPKIKNNQIKTDSLNRLIKECTKCKIEKELNEFSKKKQTKSGFRSSCKQCENEYGKKWREENSKHRKEYYTKWNEENKEYKKVE